MRKALWICSALRRSSSEMRMTASSHRYSTSRPLAMMKKFWSMLWLTTPMITANVMVVVAQMMLERFFRNSLECRRRGVKRNTSRLRPVATSA